MTDTRLFTRVSISDKFVSADVAMDASGTRKAAGIPLMRPQLPTSDRVTPFLRRIDATRHYTNSGPLLVEFEGRLADHFGVGGGNLTALSSATMGLLLALRSFDIAPGARCVLPSWTFTATASAVCGAGLEPWFLDVDPDTWALDPAHVAAQVAASERPVGAVVVVAPFGAAVDVAAWDRLSREVKVPVVIDAAASFDSIAVGAAPVVVSLHATKALGIGEGGLVASTDAARIARIRRDANFGFVGGGRVETIGMNAKLSEYAAAVGLAALDEWPQKREAYARVATHYVAALASRPNIALAPGVRAGHVSSTFNVDLGGARANAVLEQLGRDDIETRRWWLEGCSRQPAYAGFAAEALPVSARLSHAVLGLPYYSDLAQSEVARVCARLDATLDRLA